MMTDSERDPVSVSRSATDTRTGSLRRMVAEHQDWLRARIRKRLPRTLRRELDSGDLEQDVVLDLLDPKHRVEVKDESHLRALLVRVVETEMRDRLRWAHRARRSREREQPLRNDSSSTAGKPFDSVTRPSQHVDRTERIGWIRAGMARLGPEDRRIVRMRVWESRPFAAIGAELGLTEDAARMRFNRALAHLAGNVARLRGGPRDE